MSEEGEPSSVGKGNIGAASCLSTILTMPIMLLLVAALKWLPLWREVDGGLFLKSLIALPLLSPLAVLFVFTMPISVVAAFAAIGSSTWMITRRRGGLAWHNRKPWLLAGAALGTSVAAILYVEAPHPLGEGIGLGTMLVAGAMTGVAAMLICRHLIRSFEG